jgi:hypothetical protein
VVQIAKQRSPSMGLFYDSEKMDGRTFLKIFALFIQFGIYISFFSAKYLLKKNNLQG